MQTILKALPQTKDIVHITIPYVMWAKNFSPEENKAFSKFFRKISENVEPNGEPVGIRKPSRNLKYSLLNLQKLGEMHNWRRPMNSLIISSGVALSSSNFRMKARVGLWGTLGYKPTTSKDTRIAPFGTCLSLILLTNSTVFLTEYWDWWSTTDLSHLFKNLAKGQK